MSLAEDPERALHHIIVENVDAVTGAAKSIASATERQSAVSRDITSAGALSRAPPRALALSGLRSPLEPRCRK